MSAILTKEVATKAVGMVMPAILALMDCSVLKRRDLHIVIADPTFQPTPSSDCPTLREAWDKGGILHEHSMGEKPSWAHPYHRIARSKTYLSWRYGLPSQIIQARMPHLLEDGDTKHFGSAVADGLVVGVSGVQPYFDQMIAGWILEACRALCIEAVAVGAIKCDEGGNFLVAPH